MFSARKRNDPESNNAATTSSENPEHKSVYDMVHNLVDQAASTYIGQFCIQKLDGLLWKIEKTAKWSLPQQEIKSLSGTSNGNENSGANPDVNQNANSNANNSNAENSKTKLIRPMPWLLFIPTIVALRVIRIGLSVGAVLIGNEPVSPSAVVYFIQTRRRKLRSVRYHGLRAIRLKKQEGPDRRRRGVIGKLTSAANYIICRSIQPSIDDKAVRVTMNSKKKEKKQMLNADGRAKRIADDMTSSSDDDAGCEELLERYAAVRSDDDSDFVNNCDDISDISITSTDESEADADNEATNNSKNKTFNDIRHIIGARMAKEKREKIESKLETLRKMISSVDGNLKVRAISLKTKLEAKIQDIDAKYGEEPTFDDENKDSAVENIRKESPVVEKQSAIPVKSSPTPISPKIATNGEVSSNDEHRKDHDTSDMEKLDEENDSPSVASKDNSGIGNHLTESENDHDFNTEDDRDYKLNNQSQDEEKVTPIINDEVKTNLQVHLKQNNNKKFNSYKTHNNRSRGRKYN